MPLNVSGPISLIGSITGQSIAKQLGLSETAQLSLFDPSVRNLLGIASGQISMFDGYGKPNTFVFNQIITSNTNDYNLRNAAIAAGWNQILVLDATVTINSGVFVGSSSTASPAFTTGSSFPVGSLLRVTNDGYIVGRGGNGGSGGGSGGGGGAGVVNSSGGSRGTSQGPANAGSPGTNTAGGAGGAQGSAAPTNPQGNPASAGGNGGLALEVLYALTLTNNNTIGGGGGGGGGGGVQFNDFPPVPGSFITISYAGGAGGALGTAGSTPQSGNGSAAGAGGSAGAAIFGGHQITYLATGTILGEIISNFEFTISSSQQEANLRTLALAAGWNGTTGVTATIGAGVYIWSDNTSTAALTINGSWPNGVTLVNNGYIIGKGGQGGSNGGTTAGASGGPALSLGLNVTIVNGSGAFIAGGGGGGGGNLAGGGGGAGGGDGGAGRFLGTTAGGAIGASGSTGAQTSSASPGGSGGGAGGGAGGTAAFGPPPNPPAQGGSGGGGGRILPGTGGAGAVGLVSTGGSGGSASNAGTVASPSNGHGSGGGGGWGASGATASNASIAGGAGGQAIALNGYAATISGSGTTYGAIS